MTSTLLNLIRGVLKGKIISSSMKCMSAKVKLSCIIWDSLPSALLIVFRLENQVTAFPGNSRSRFILVGE